jgi:hypothetical protein
MFCLWKGNENNELGRHFYVKEIMPAVKRVEFVSDRMSLVAGAISLFCASTEDNIDDVRAASTRNWNVFIKVPKCRMKILLGTFNAKVGKEDTQWTIGNESLYVISNDNGVTAVNSATSKDVTVKSMMFPHCKIHKYTWTSSDENLQSNCVKFEVFTAVTMKNVVFWDVTPCGFCMNR